MSAETETAKQLRLEARKIAAERPDDAIALLDRAIAMLKAALATRVDASLYRDLAECFGMRGGMYRRRRMIKEAVASYEAGAGYEQDEEYGADNSYNMVNALVVPVLGDPALVANDNFRNKLRNAIVAVRRQTRASRSSDFWAFADLALCLLLDGKKDDAERAFDRFVQLGGLTPGSFESTMQVLRELQEVFSAAGRPEVAALDSGVDYLRRASESGPGQERTSCFVLMPLRAKKDAEGRTIDFDDIYRRIIAPAISDAGLSPIRADKETDGPIIHKAMFERLLLSEIAVADLTLNNPNVFYELGVRHGGKARSTVLISAEASAPFDVNLLRSLRYKLDNEGKIADAEVERMRAELKAALEHARQNLVESNQTDNPVAALLQDFQLFDKPARYKADVFRSFAEYEEQIKQDLRDARNRNSVEDLRRIEERIQLEQTEPAVMIDVMLSYRALQEWNGMLAFINRMPKVVRDTEMVREQHALALNRRNKGGDRYRAIELIEGLIAEKGPSSEACAILGRIYKDNWQEMKEHEPLRARGMLKRAIKAYREGFHADLRDTLPGINLATLLFVDGSKSSLAELSTLLPVLRYVAELRLQGEPDYWDHATLMELAALADDGEGIEQHLTEALGAMQESFEGSTTARNLRFISDAPKKLEKSGDMLSIAIKELEGAAARIGAKQPKGQQR